jgi:hypothetical protein
MERRHLSWQRGQALTNLTPEAFASPISSIAIRRWAALVSLPCPPSRRRPPTFFLSTSNTAARYAGPSTGLAKVAAQPLPRRQVVIGTDKSPASASGVVPTVGKSARP